MEIDINYINEYNHLREYYIDGKIFKTIKIPNSIAYKSNVIYCFTDHCFKKNRTGSIESEADMRINGIPSRIVSFTSISHRLERAD